MSWLQRDAVKVTVCPGFKMDPQATYEQPSQLEGQLECSETAPHRTQLEQLEHARLAYNAKVLELKTLPNPTLVIIYSRVSGKNALKGKSFEMQKWDVLNLIRLLDWSDVKEQEKNWWHFVWGILVSRTRRAA
jgi:hypothetical protein